MFSRDQVNQSTSKMKFQQVKLSFLLLASLLALALAAPASNELNQNDDGLKPSSKETIDVENPDRSIQRTITGIITNFFGRFSSIFGIPSPPQEDFVPSRDLPSNNDADSDSRPSDDRNQPNESPDTYASTVTMSTMDEEVPLRERQENASEMEAGARDGQGKQGQRDDQGNNDRRRQIPGQMPTKPPRPTTPSQAKPAEEGDVTTVFYPTTPRTRTTSTVVPTKKLEEDSTSVESNANEMFQDFESYETA